MPLGDGSTQLDELGDDQALSVVDPFGGPAIVIETASGTRPTIHVTTAGDQGIDVASGNTIRGINIQTDANNSGLDDGSGGGSRQKGDECGGGIRFLAIRRNGADENSARHTIFCFHSGAQ